MMLAGVAAAGIALSACSGTDVELKGGLFDLAGISGSTAVQTKEPQMADRAGLVIPPSTASLPPPGAPPQAVAVAGGEAFPVNPEDAKKMKNAELIAQHKAFCERAQQRYDTGMTNALENSPWGACEASVLRNLSGKDLAGKKAVGTQ
ncbi:MAG: hypothetical protein KKB37_04140 [Alphaproteobacteria bacterium]|nr:hypothetical protein [Alphaproteobacteria bacterium]